MRRPLIMGTKLGAAKAPSESAERIVNGYIEAVPEGKEPTTVYGTPGLVGWSDEVAGEMRGHMEMAGQYFAVIGFTLYNIPAGGTPNECGMIPGDDLVSMDGDGTNVVVVAGGEIYVWDGLALNPVTDPDAPSASSVAYTDGYFVFSETDTGQFFISGLQAPLDYDALDFATGEWKPDNLRRCFVMRRTLYLCGTDSIEAQQNTGGADFPFAPYQDLLIDVGIAGREAICATNDTMYWLANDWTIRRLDGITATKISTPSVFAEVKTWADKTSTIASAHVWGDHLFISFRNPDGCVVFDQATERWHQRRSYGSNTWQVSHIARCFDKTICGSVTGGTVFEMDDEAYDEAGDILPFEMVTPFAYDRGMRITISEVEVIAEAGVGSLTLDPAITLDRTTDGEDYSQPIQRRLGKTGERGRRAVFGPQGQARAMAFRLKITDPVRRAISGIYIEGDSEL